MFGEFYNRITDAFSYISGQRPGRHAESPDSKGSDDLSVRLSVTDGIRITRTNGTTRLDVNFGGFNCVENYTWYLNGKMVKGPCGPYVTSNALLTLEGAANKLRTTSPGEPGPDRVMLTNVWIRLAEYADKAR